MEDKAITADKIDGDSFVSFFADVAGPTITLYTDTQLTYGTPAWNHGGGLTSNSFVAPVKGLYNLSFNVQVDNPTGVSNNRFEFIMRHNGSVICEGYGDAVNVNFDPCINMTIDRILDVGDVVIMQGKQQNFTNQVPSGTFCGHLVYPIE